ncbi:MAG: hypothetical protein K2X86_06270 [Cytophagaceae bacterium]|nr:hypothetical protein [Cytophagaceae bacterium]
MEAQLIKTHRGKEEMFSLIQSFKAKGLSQHSFCKERGLSYSVFQCWLKKFKKEASLPEAGFVELKASLPKTFPAHVEIVFPSGAKVILPTADPALIRSLVL